MNMNGPAAQTRDATDTTVRELPSRECSVVSLYYEYRPHYGLRWVTPTERAQTINPRRDTVLRRRNGSAPLERRTQLPETAGVNSNRIEFGGKITKAE